MTTPTQEREKVRGYPNREKKKKKKKKKKESPLNCKLKAAGFSGLFLF